ncbi:putative dienelactone hydrolase [Variovorax boronicumulans]|uniref:alpha/beta hydrolase family protein n=1 Tax=Variovorax boronicumulans TaxID=436515 RepID=UPI0024761A98|nr:dienelactone hydrolase [Variovorax boronicumulans]MDH6168948.1 putative dienelactone hydrolase [Variovorax boronicumulans]
MPLLRFLVATAFCLLATFAQAAGFSTFETPADAQGPALRGAVWTPCAAPAGEIRLGHYALSGVRDCPIPAGGPLPLIVLSHGYGGSFLGHHDTAQVLADAGFVVAAINHSSDNFQLRGGPDDKLSALATRTTDIKRLIDYMLAQWPAHDRLAAGQIGFFGFSRGGYTGLALAGGRPDFKRLPTLPSSPCASAPEGAACGQMRQRFRELLAAPLTRDTRIRAAVIADPLGMVFDAERLKNVTIPILLWASERGGDGVLPRDVEAVRRSLPSPPDFRVQPGSAHFAFLAPCSTAQASEWPDICSDAPGFDRVAFHDKMNAGVLAFFSQHLGQAPKP